MINNGIGLGLVTMMSMMVCTYFPALCIPLYFLGDRGNSRGGNRQEPIHSNTWWVKMESFVVNQTAGLTGGSLCCRTSVKSLDVGGYTFF